MDKLKKVFTKNFNLIVIFLAGLLLGAVGDYYLLFPSYISAYRGSIIRSKENYQFINPILTCEIGPKDSFAELKPIESKIKDYINSKIGNKEVDDLAVYVRMMNSGRWIGINEDHTFSPASLMKVLVMISYLKEAQINQNLLSSQIFYGKKAPYDKSSAQNLEIGKSYGVKELLDIMIKQSDNASLYLLIDNLGIRPFKEVFDSLNINFPESLNEESLETMSPKLYSLLFRILYGASFLDRKFSEMALSLLSGTDFNYGLAAGISSDLKISHKFGSTSGVKNNQEFKELHDCGIVYYPDHPYFLCVMTKGRTYGELAKDIQEISKLVYEGVDALFSQ